MRTSLHVIRSISPHCGGTSVCVKELASALSRTGRYAGRLLTFAEPAPCGDSSALLLSRFGAGTRHSTEPRASASGQAALAGAACHSPDAALIALPWRPSEFLTGGPVRKALQAAVEASDIVHIHGIWEAHCIAAGTLASRAGIPYLVSAHGMLDPWAVQNKRWKKWLYARLVERPNLNRAACLCALTDSEVNDYRAFGLTPPVAVVPNGIVPVQAGAGEFCDAFPELRGRKLVLYLSRIHYKKGVDLLSRVWARICPDFPGAHLVLAGPDFEDTLPAVRRLIHRLGIAGSVTFTGMLDTRLKWSALAAASLFVLPSHSEGFSVAILEAMAAAVPVVITRQCHFPEVATYNCGVVVEPREDELEPALRRLLSASEGQRRQMGLRGRSLVQQRYSWDRIGSRMADVFDWALGGVHEFGPVSKNVLFRLDRVPGRG